MNHLSIPRFIIAFLVCIAIQACRNTSTGESKLTLNTYLERAPEKYEADYLAEALMIESDNGQIGNRSGMVWISGGKFTMGGEDHQSLQDEQFLHDVYINGFWMDATEVTNVQFKAFVDATGYITQAERNPAAQRMMMPGIDKDSLPTVPFSWCFHQPQNKYGTLRPEDWWVAVPGADWKHPQGPGQTH